MSCRAAFALVNNPRCIQRASPILSGAGAIWTSLVRCQGIERSNRIRSRGAKTKVQIKLQDLPQGALPALPAREEDDDSGPSYPPVIQQHLNNVQKFTDCVVLTRVGNFYEMYADQAEQYGPLLNLKVAYRRVNSKAGLGPVAMAGFQIFQLDRYLKLLVQDLNKQVAISEELRDSAVQGPPFTRKVTRVITAGTLIDENFVDPYENNYLLAIHAVHDIGEPTGTGNKSLQPKQQTSQTPHLVGLSWVDLSSGDFFTQETDAALLGSTIARISPREVLLDPSLEGLEQSELRTFLGEGSHIVTYHNPSSQFARLDAWNEVLDEKFEAETSEMTELEIGAGSLLIDYVKDRLLDLKITLRPPVRRTDDDSMRIDKQSLRGLEVRATLREGLYQGSLLHAIRRTVTKSGARLLMRRLVSPSMSVSTIASRLDLVSELLEHNQIREDIVASLRRTFDTLRLLQKFSIGRGDADDILALAKTIVMTEQLCGILKDHAINQARRSRANDPSQSNASSLAGIVDSLPLEKPVKLARRILESIDEEGLSRQHNVEDAVAAEVAGFAEQVTEAGADAKGLKRPKLGGIKASSTSGGADNDSGEIWIMRRDASKTLQHAHMDLESLLDSRVSLAETLRESLRSSSLTLKWTPQLGHFCHVKGKDAKADIPGARNISSTKTTRTFYISEWTNLGVKIDEAKLRIRTEEQRVFASLRNDVIANLVTLRRNAAVLDELDVACSSAILAKESNLVRPIVHAGTSFKIIGGRHPVVDLGLQQHGRLFTSNDCSMSEQERIMLITGPNMAGKSTYLRQNALITILAQTGCFVPADYAEIGLVDKIFSRVGSADNLFNHQSTFMVEMLEVAEILNQATPRSFVIMDEVGRGTTPEDGLAVGYACLQHLNERNQSRTLFATHFHALADMTKDFDKLACYCTDVAEGQDGSWVYVHKLKRGVNRESHALKVARMAGMPEEAIQVAERMLEQIGHSKGQAGHQPVVEEWSRERVQMAAGSAGLVA